MMKAKVKVPPGVTLKNGYVVGARCPHRHSGNRRLAYDRKGWAQCVGCGWIILAQDLPALVARSR